MVFRTCIHTARFEFGANVVIQVLFNRSSFLIRQIIGKECRNNWAQLEMSPIGNETCVHVSKLIIRGCTLGWGFRFHWLWNSGVHKGGSRPKGFRPPLTKYALQSCIALQALTRSITWYTHSECPSARRGKPAQAAPLPASSPARACAGVDGSRKRTKGP